MTPEQATASVCDAAERARIARAVADAAQVAYLDAIEAALAVKVPAETIAAVAGVTRTAIYRALDRRNRAVSRRGWQEASAIVPMPADDSLTEYRAARRIAESDRELVTMGYAGAEEEAYRDDLIKAGKSPMITYADVMAERSRRASYAADGKAAHKGKRSA